MQKNKNLTCGPPCHPLSSSLSSWRHSVYTGAMAALLPCPPLLPRAAAPLVDKKATSAASLSPLAISLAPENPNPSPDMAVS